MPSYHYDAPAHHLLANGGCCFSIAHSAGRACPRRSPNRQILKKAQKPFKRLMERLVIKLNCIIQHASTFAFWLILPDEPCRMRPVEFAVYLLEHQLNGLQLFGLLRQTGIFGCCECHFAGLIWCRSVGRERGHIPDKARPSNDQSL